MTTSLLPPNATGLERALEAGVRAGNVVTPVDVIDVAETCPADLLPWLAWGLSVDSWDGDWSEEDKRDAVANSLAFHRIKGTRLSVETVLSRFDKLAELVEWHQAEPRRAPNTFDVIVPLVMADGTAPGGRRSTAAFAEAIIREVSRVKPLREHMTLVQALTVAGSVSVQGVARAFIETRQDTALVADTSPAWDLYLQTHDGEPLLDAADGTFLDTAP
ncbi:phage tail protein I [Sphingomonas sp. PAMC26645]|uniref:phage tail protein I n=1 Tax=Sphingomonas sp. PAMC26645 TaxID=2565555 RepID=UPI00109DF063|nr:phage tail protein I [Sphingomonas sp. PAMC26645]QCB41040.1 phage tail protein I [Sphingomonas sp. PAMC26645]